MHFKKAAAKKTVQTVLNFCEAVFFLFYEVQQ
nr:MAG TPA: hypothetical protein [Herelleviridae sp.]